MLLVCIFYFEYCNSVIRKDLFSLIESLVVTSSIYGRTEALSGRTFNFASNFSRRIECPACFLFGRATFDFGRTLSEVGPLF